MGGQDMDANKQLFTLGNPEKNEIQLSVEPVVYGCYGVYADRVLVTIYADRFAADAHCQRVLKQQAEEKRQPLTFG
jgi:hypothetical protein